MAQIPFTAVKGKTGLYRRKGKRADTFMIVYTVDGKRKRETFQDKETAIGVLDLRRTEIRQGIYNKNMGIEEQKPYKFEELSEMYMEKYAKPYKKSWKSSDLNSIKHLKAFFREWHIHKITKKDVEDYKLERMKHVSGPSINRELAALRCMFNRAKDWGMVKHNPVEGIKFFKENQRDRYLRKDEIGAFLNSCRDDLRAFAIVALGTGMRTGEIRSIKWADVDMGEGIISLLGSNTKNGQSRKVLMSELVKRTISRIPKYSGEYAFSTKDGKKLSKSYFRKSFLKAKIESGILIQLPDNNIDISRDFVLHDLRHSFGSHLAMNGYSEFTISELLGHSKKGNVTLRYMHLANDYKRQAVETMGRIISDSMLQFPKKVLTSKISEFDTKHQELQPVEHKAVM
jgi:integrase